MSDACTGWQRKIAGTEILLGTDAITNLIRENKSHQMSSMMQSGGASGMHTLNMDMMRLVREGYNQGDGGPYTNDKGIWNSISRTMSGRRPVRAVGS
ncbi:MAG: hypothetical protein ACLRMZ_00475 [Blautia marasmi]